MLIEFVGNIVTQPFGRLARLLPWDDVAVVHHGIDQSIQVLLGGSKADVLVVHLTPDHFMVQGEAQAVALMQGYCDALRSFAAANRTVVIVNTLAPPVHRLVGSDHVAQLRLTARLNEMLFACSDETGWVSMADVAGVLALNGLDKSISATNGAMMRMPYTSHVLPALVDEYARAIRERFVVRKKVILLDADNTLWGGVVGEDGVEVIQVDEQYPGILFRRFQAALASLRDSGILLCLVSKNNEADVREAFDRRDMPLRWDSFAAIRANWEPKSANIGSIAEQLNVGIDSMLFIDDNPVEIAEVTAQFPQIAARQFHVREAADALGWLASIPDLGTWSPSAEDLAKSEQYRQEAQRQEVAASATSIEDYIASLGMVLEAGINRADHVKRIAQLTNKTNQFNLTTRRYSEADILAAMEEGQVFDFRVRDRFGDMGIIAVVIVRGGEIEAFLMSCRALGRKVEEDVVKYVLSKIPAGEVRARYIRSGKNPMVADFYDRVGFSLVEGDDDVRRYVHGNETDYSLTNELIEVD
ncbi:HAD-IIIC family phosphatase [Sphingopyxis terrae]|uniref:HAD-IIIC family phosphatase n=1 Tax=Sphingopyxis terrae TaxID=33052 RepID=UPI003F7D3760